MRSGDGTQSYCTFQPSSVGAVTARVADFDGVESWNRIDEVPFESRRGYHAVLGHVGNGVHISFPPATPAQGVSSYAGELSGIGLIEMIDPTDGNPFHEQAQAALDYVAGRLGRFLADHPTEPIAP